MSKAPASIFQDTITNGLKSRHYLFIPHDVVKAATDMAGYASGFTVQSEPAK